MRAVLGFTWREDKNIVDEDHDEFVQILHEYGVHELHEGGGCIGQTEGHHGILVGTVTCPECSFRDILRPDLDLMITHPQINL